MCSHLNLKVTHVGFTCAGNIPDERQWEVHCVSYPDSVCEENGDWPLDIDDLLRFSYQVAQGLDFLAAKNVSDYEALSERGLMV